SHPSRDREGPQSIAPVAALAGEPLRAFLDDVAHPEERLDIVAQGRTPEQSDLGRKRRSLSRESALPFDALEHRRFFPAGIGAGAGGSARPAPAPPPRLRQSRSPGSYGIADIHREGRRRPPSPRRPKSRSVCPRAGDAGRLRENSGL